MVKIIFQINTVNITVSLEQRTLYPEDLQLPLFHMFWSYYFL